MILRHLVVRRRVYHRRRQVKAAGTTNRFEDKDPRSQPSVSSRQSRKTVACIQERRLGLPHLATLHLPPASTPQAKDCFPCPCATTIGEEAGNAPSGVAFACPASCTTFEKSSLLSCRVPPPTHDMPSLSIDLGSLRPNCSTTNAGSQVNSSQLEQVLLNEITRPYAVDTISVLRGSLCTREWPVLGDISARARSHHPYCDPKQYHRSLGPSLPI